MGYIGKESEEEEPKNTCKVQDAKPNHKENCFQVTNQRLQFSCETGWVTPDCVQTPALVTLNPGQTEEIN